MNWTIGQVADALGAGFALLTASIVGVEGVPIRALVENSRGPKFHLFRQAALSRFRKTVATFE